MKVKYLLSVLIIFIAQIAIACPVCEKQQPKITRGLTHGAGPQSDWDWVIIAIITLIAVLTLIYSIKYLLKPGEKNNDHIKQSILSN
jgi:NADH:ubiquinone oxidoreductase subunit 5 (subunit L)/multisubunit Na+/H+ antiporter MnhA subunit